MHANELPANLETQTKRRALIIDDDKEIRELIRFALEDDGFEVAEAAEGLSAIRQNTLTPADLVVADLVMPTQDGIETILQIRRDYPKTRIIAISGAVQTGAPNYLAMARKLGADQILAKPFRTEKLVEMARRMLPSHR